jgi:hypothetical protein
MTMKFLALGEHTTLPFWSSTRFREPCGSIEIFEDVMETGSNSMTLDVPGVCAITFPDGKVKAPIKAGVAGELVTPDVFTKAANTPNCGDQHTLCQFTLTGRVLCVHVIPSGLVVAIEL